MAAAALVLSCGTLRAGGTFVTALAEKPYTLDPAGINDLYSMAVMFNIYEPLVAFEGKLHCSGFVPALSTEVPSKTNGLISADGRTYIFPVRKGVKFHDGSELTAEDAAYSLIRLMITDRFDGPSFLFLKPLLGVNSTRDSEGKIAVDFLDFTKAVQARDGKLIITLKEPYPPFLSLLASTPFVTSKAWAAAQGEWDATEAEWKKFNNRSHKSSHLMHNADGTGPFKLGGFDAETGRVTLVRNDNYWRKNADLERLIFMQVESEASRQSMLEAGDVDYAELERSGIASLAGAKTVTTLDDLPNYSLYFMAFSFNLDISSNQFAGSGMLDGKGIPPYFFSDADVRKGFAFALDYGKYLTMALRSKGARLTTPVLRPEAPAQAPFDFDLKKAEEHLKKAFGGKLWETGFVLTAACTDSFGDGQTALNILAEGLREINPKFVIRTQRMSLGGLKSSMKLHRIPLFAGTFAPDYPDYYDFAFNMLHSEGLMPQYMGYKNPQADKACEESLYKEGAAREKAFAELDRIYAQDAPYIMLPAPVKFKAFRKGLSGMDAENGLFTLYNFVDYYKVAKL